MSAILCALLTISLGEWSACRMDEDVLSSRAQPTAYVDWEQLEGVTSESILDVLQGLCRSPEARPRMAQRHVAAASALPFLGATKTQVHKCRLLLKLIALDPRQDELRPWALQGLMALGEDPRFFQLLLTNSSRKGDLELELEVAQVLSQYPELEPATWLFKGADRPPDEALNRVRSWIGRFEVSNLLKRYRKLETPDERMKFLVRTWKPADVHRTKMREPDKVFLRRLYFELSQAHPEVAAAAAMSDEPALERQARWCLIHLGAPKARQSYWSSLSRPLVLESGRGVQMPSGYELEVQIFLHDQGRCDLKLEFDRDLKTEPKEQFGERNFGSHSARLKGPLEGGETSLVLRFLSPAEPEPESKPTAYRVVFSDLRFSGILAGEDHPIQWMGQIERVPEWDDVWVWELTDVPSCTWIRMVCRPAQTGPDDEASDH
ncbi:MAG: hypothetical protein RL885_20310 [Planctomycetota bacterium]